MNEVGVQTVSQITCMPDCFILSLLTSLLQSPKLVSIYTAKIDSQQTNVKCIFIAKVFNSRNSIAFHCSDRLREW